MVSQMKGQQKQTLQSLVGALIEALQAKESKHEDYGARPDSEAPLLSLRKL